MKAKKLILWFACVGCVITLVIFFVAYLFPTFAYSISQYMLIFCPPSFGFMAMEFTHKWFGRTFILIFITLENTILYAIYGVVVAFLFWLADRISRQTNKARFNGK